MLITSIIINLDTRLAESITQKQFVSFEILCRRYSFKFIFYYKTLLSSYSLVIIKKLWSYSFDWIIFLKCVHHLFSLKVFTYMFTIMSKK